MGTWLSGPGVTAGRIPRKWRGERLGLPENGPGSVSSTGRRAVAILIDILLSGLVAGLFTAPELPRNWSLLAWALIMIVPTALFGRTPGMVVMGIQVLRVDNTPTVGLWRAAVRTVLIFPVIPAVIWDVDNRGLHDRLTGTVVVRTR